MNTRKTKNEPRLIYYKNLVLSTFSRYTSNYIKFYSSCIKYKEYVVVEISNNLNSFIAVDFNFENNWKLTIRSIKFLVFYSLILFVSGYWYSISLLHMRIHHIILPEDPSRYESPSHKYEESQNSNKRNRPSPRKGGHRRSHRLLLHRMHLQRMVHLRDNHQIHSLPQQVRVHHILGQHNRLHSHI